MGTTPPDRGSGAGRPSHAASARGSGAPLKITAAERPNTLGLSQRDLVMLLEKMESGDKVKTPVRRDYTRWPFRHASIRVTLTQPSGAEVVLKMACRNISRGGVALLHNAYIHPGSVVMVALPRLASGAKEVTGVVKRCQHRRGIMHEIGVQFDTQVDIAEYLGGGNGVEFFSLENVNPEKLVGQLLYVEDSDVDFRIFQHFLRETGLAIKHVVTLKEAIAEATNGYNIIVADWRLPDGKGTEMIAKIRDSKVMTPVILVTADPVGVMRSGLWDLPNTGLLTKPLSQQQLIRALAERLLIRPADPNSELLEGGGDDHVEIAKALGNQFDQMGEHLAEAVKKNDTNAVLEICMQLRGAAPTLGATQITRLAEAVITQVDAKTELSASQKQLDELITACRRFKAAA